MAELKPCPFCGGNELAWAFHLDYATVKCPKCRVHLVVSDKRYLTINGAKKHYEPLLEKAWNRRAGGSDVQS
jgi:phage FluMu protein Com